MKNDKQAFCADNVNCSMIEEKFEGIQLKINNLIPRSYKWMGIVYTQATSLQDEVHTQLNLL